MTARRWFLALTVVAGAGFSLPSQAVPLHGASFLRNEPAPGASSDPLHGECAGCVDNGFITPTSQDPLPFSFTKSPDKGTATFFVDILIPDNIAGANSESFSIAGTHTANTTVADVLESATPWTSGFLDAYLGISASPANPIGAFLPLTKQLDSGATGYFDYVFDFGSVTFGSLTDPSFTSTFIYPTGTVILAFADTQTCTTKHGVTTCTDDWTATANSSAILETGGQRVHRVPEPATLSILGIGVVGLWAFFRRKSRA
jgi:hypothetical protein